ncbi:PH domain-containing protein [Jiangella gansuensis]|uniref:PH domain-containing protein n=1 Tax=Jiangella gansuensis TaxID=281473 RepID=UPI00047BF8EB|nr:PH domain-containing protein [Jiangella gansuensis]
MAEQIALRLPEHRVERKAILGWALQSAAGFAVLIGGLTVAYVLADAARPWLGPPLVAAIVWAVLQIPGMPLWRYAVHRWEVTDEAVYAVTGWIVREWRVVPISRIQTVDTIRGPIQQLLGLSTLVVTTASSRGAVKIPGLASGTASRVAEELSRITQRTPGDAT